MPELPEVETVCRTLEPHLTGRSFTNFELLWPRTLGTQDASRFSTSITGRTIQRVDRRAKLITINLDNLGAVTVHLRMTGELLLVPAGAQAPHGREAYLRAGFLLDDGSELLFYDVRKFGRISYLEPASVQAMQTYFGIEPLSPEFTAQWLLNNLQRRKRQLKPLLLDQTFIAGLGNIYVDESLFASRIHPMTRSDQIDDRQATELHRAIVESLLGALARRGTTLRDYRSGLGEMGGNQSELQVYGKKPGSPCPRCGTGLERLIVGQRGTILCPKCQPPPSAGRPSR